MRSIAMGISTSPWQPGARDSQVPNAPVPMLADVSLPADLEPYASLLLSTIFVHIFFDSPSHEEG